ncbi:cerebellar degeneration-related protein 2 isoform X1 [Carcharodon carcharias]|uniref:cerebellar degeneration-related protein 2 isoform X1 n=1 Tax=Carcharodon carcharias TaxID=13397 RepID=UPI001B7EAF5A|nr:cerebellar degeneration-related protein 2 isoform X1 [Carcharodon carcharias]
MLTDSIIEEFELREEEPWYQQQQNMEHDLHLAAELGKTLLDRNTELEEALQQMYGTNQEQLQEIEYLSKQIELLRQMNEQHAKVYEQLDVTARELEVTNQKLVTESKTSQSKIISLAETIEGLQSHVDELQRQLEELKDGSRKEGTEQKRAMHSLPCLKELYDLRKYFVYDHLFAAEITSDEAQVSPLEDENERLKKNMSMLQAQLTLERQRRESVEQEYSLLLKENSELEKSLSNLDDYKQSIQELENKVVELRQRSRGAADFVSVVDNLLPESFLFSGKDSLDLVHFSGIKVCVNGESLQTEHGPPNPSEALLKSSSDEDLLKGHEQTCIRRAEAVRQRGISLLNEVDEQYIALQLKYNELLSRCHRPGDALSHKAVQTSRRLSQDQSGKTPQNDQQISASEEPLRSESAACTAQLPIMELPSSSSNTQPEYKILFKEIFSCIRKTKEEINENRLKYKSISLQYPVVGQLQQEE